MAEYYLAKLVLKGLLIRGQIAFNSLDVEAIVIAFANDLSNYIELREISFE